MSRRYSVLLMVLLAVFGVAALPVYAGADSGATFALDCNGFSGTGGSVLLDRDNTGNQREAFIVSATDGAGNIIYQPVQDDSFFVGGTVSWAGSAAIKWSAAPEFNPLTLRVVSSAGNGLDEQSVVLATGTCADLPTYGATPGVFVVEGDTLTLDGNVVFELGDTSPDVALNAVPPRPSDPAFESDTEKNTLAGWLIVNTDNLFLRSGDAPEYSDVGIVDGGTVLVPLGRNANFSWWYVQAGDLVGWAKAQFLVARGDLTDVPVITAEGQLALPTFFLFDDAWLYSAADDTSLPLCTIAGDQEYLVTGRNSASDWVEVQATCDNAIVKGFLMNATGALRNPANTFIEVTG